MNLFHKAKNAMRERRAFNHANIKQAMSGITPRSAGLVFDLSRDEDTTHLSTNKRANIKAVELVSSLLDSFSLPVRPRLEYHGMIKNAVDSNGGINEGIIKLGAVVRTMMGHKAHVDIPVIVKANRLLEPAIFFYESAPYVMCRQAFEDLIKRGSLEKNSQFRRMFSPPNGSNGNVSRERIHNLEHMFSPGPRNPFNFRRQYDKEAQLLPQTGFAVYPTGGLAPIAVVDKYDDALSILEDQGVSGKIVDQSTGKEVTAAKEPRKRTNIDVPTEVPELWEHDVQDEMLDPAERRRDKLYGIGADVVLTEDIEARQRGGKHFVIPSGERGKVLKDMEGDGKMLYVDFKEMQVTTPVPKRMLRNASLIKVKAQVEPDFVDQSYMMSDGGNYYIGASVSIEAPDEYDPEEMITSSGYVFFKDGTWFPWSNDQGSKQAAEYLNKEKWEIYVNADALPLMDSNVIWSKTAAAADQIENEIKAMLREGYGNVDIKEAIKRKYPEQADEVLSSLE